MAPKSLGQGAVVASGHHTGASGADRNMVAVMSGPGRVVAALLGMLVAAVAAAAELVEYYGRWDLGTFARVPEAGSKNDARIYSSTGFAGKVVGSIGAEG